LLDALSDEDKEKELAGEEVSREAQLAGLGQTEGEVVVVSSRENSEAP